MRSLWQKYVFPLCIIGQFIVNITLDKHSIGEIPTLNVTINIKGKVKCLIFTLSLIQIVKLQTFSLGKIVQNHSISIKWNSFAWQIFDNYGREGEMKLCGVMKSVVTLLIKVVHISTNSSQSPPIWEEIMTWLSPSLNTTSESASESQSQSLCLVCNMCWLRDQKIFERLHNDIWEFHQNRNNTWKMFSDSQTIQIL